LGRADLHSHSICSDGVLSPAELLDVASKARLGAFSITDHDSIDAYRNLPADRPELDLIVGVEISAFHDGGEIHILGYFVDLDDPGLTGLLGRMAASRRERAGRILDRLGAVGIRFPAQERSRLLSIPCVGRPHIARALVGSGTAATRRDAFNRYLVPGTPGFERKADLPAAREVVEIITRAGGVAVWAHPGTDCLIDPRPLALLQSCGLAGLEAYHPSHTRGGAQSLATLARRRGLVSTGGSDFHGDGREGARVGDVAVGTEVVELLARRRGRVS
jgi:predicted metal-dependent phosphoesterase TrpH